MAASPTLKPVFWIGSTKADLSALPEDVRDEVGQALYEAQKGQRHPSAKPLRGYGGASVLEVISDHAGDTYRAVYTVKWPAGIYVLHVFQKKSKSGISTPKAELNLIDGRLKRLQELHDEAARKQKGKKDER